MLHVPPVVANEARKFGLEWLRKKVFRYKELQKENELLKAQLDPQRAFERLMADMIPSNDDDGMYWKKDGSGPYCPICLHKDHVDVPLAHGATKGTYLCAIHQTDYWSREYRESRASRPVRFRFHTWHQQSRYLEAESRRRGGY